MGQPIDDTHGPDLRKQYCEFEMLGIVHKAPEFREFASGKGVAKAYISYRKSRKNKETGEFESEYHGWDCEVWNDLGRDFMARVAAKDGILVRGRLKVEKWEDKATGSQRSKTVMDVTEFEIINHEADRMNRGAAFKEKREAAQEAKDGLEIPKILREEDMPF